MSGSSALIVTVPQADAVVRAAGGTVSHRWLHRPAPPHVTILWPFIAPERIDAAVDERLGRLFGEIDAFVAEFTTIGAFPSVAYLAPHDPEPFRLLTRSVHAAWPECAPYGGAFDTIVPHLTLREDTADVREGTSQLLPLAVRVEQVELRIDHRWRGWRCRTRYPLRSASAT